MKKLTRDDLYSLEKYSQIRSEFRQKIIAHKKDRQVRLGNNATLYFEDQLTVQYQIQEMLRIEKIFEADSIEEELQSYNPLIPNGSNWKATFMVEYDDVAERKKMLAKLIGVERKIWVKINGCDKVYPIANEDLERETESKTSAVHFLRFELSPDMIKKAKSGAAIAMGCDHSEYHQLINPIADNVRQALMLDLT